MTEPTTQEKMDTLLFTNLITMLGSSTMQQLGKLVNPMTNETEINLEGAQVTIDMLSMLQKRTDGNLSGQEARMLSDLISSLQMNYVEVSKSAPSEEKEADTAEKAPKEENQPDDTSTEAPNSNGGDKKDPKFHKSYD